MAGTLIVDTVQGSGGGSYDPDDVAKTRAKLWVHFQGTGTVTIKDSHNVTSITDSGVGDYTVNFSVTMTDANYAWTDGHDADRSEFWPPSFSQTTTTFRMRYVRSTDTTDQDAAHCCLIVYSTTY